MSTLNKKKEKKPLLSEESLKSENIKARITTFIDLDILDELKKQAEKKHTKYQTLLNQILRNHLIGDNDLEKRVQELEKQISRVLKNSA